MSIGFATLNAVAQTLLHPMVIIGYILFGLYFYKLNLKTTKMQKMIIGEQLSSPFDLTISQLVLGIVAGTIGSIFMTYIGVTFTDNSIILVIFTISLFLMMIDPKYVCFSYSGSILGLISLALSHYNKIFDIDIVSLIVMIGILHIIEGVLVLIDGDSGSIPVFSNRDGNIVGGFALKRYWILPIAIMFIVSGNGTKLYSPTGWPYIKYGFQGEFVKIALFNLMCVMGGLGYSSVTFTKTKSGKILSSGITIMIYGFILILLGRAANYGIAFKIIILVLMPLLHEFMLRMGKYMEIKGKPKFISDDEGLTILEVAPMSLAQEMGIKSGDKVIEINNKKVDNDEDIYKIISESTNFLWIKIKNAKGIVKEVSSNKYNNTKKIGMIFVPRQVPDSSLVVNLNEKNFSEILQKVKKNDEDGNNKNS